MSKDRQEKMDLEIALAITEIQKGLGRRITEEEQWIIRIAFLSGNTYGLGEARQIVQETK